MWQLIGGIVLALAGLAGFWYSIRKSAGATQDRDAAEAGQKVAEDRAAALTAKALQDEKDQRSKESNEVKSLDAKSVAVFLRDSGANPTASKP